MTDLTKIEKALGLLEEWDRRRLMVLPPSQVEFFGVGGWTQMEDRTPWIDTVTYRAKVNPRRYWLRDGLVHDAPVEGAIEVMEVPK